MSKLKVNRMGVCDLREPTIGAGRAVCLEITGVTLVKLLVSIAATALLVADAVLCRRGQSGRWLRGRNAALAVLGVVAALSWWNLFQFGARGFVQGAEHFHYFLGAKYFPELGYTGLYRCAALVEAQLAVPERLQGRLIRDLESNRFEPLYGAIADPGRCTSRFEPERWQQFQQDVTWFLARIPLAKWQWMIMDHGYNAPPVWGVLGVPIANALDVSLESLTRVSLIDTAAQLVMWAAVAWAFGWRTLCVALVFWGTNGLGEFSFVGGGYLRQDWLCAAVVGLCALRRGKHAAAGALLATSALLRIFPIFLILALGVGTLCAMWKARSLAPPRTHLRFAAGCLLAVATLVPLSGVTSGFDSWPRFAETISLHRETSLSNYVGLLTVAGYDANNLPPVDLSIRESRRWEARRAATLRERSWLVAATWLLYAALVVRAARRAPDWVIAALGAGGVFMFLEITAYYYPVLIAFALLHERDDLTGPALAAFSAISLLLSSVWADSGLDFVHAATSAALMPLVLVLTWRAGQPGEPCPDP